MQQRYAAISPPSLSEEHDMTKDGGLIHEFVDASIDMENNEEGKDAVRYDNILATLEVAIEELPCM
jgi:hypothetical protein